MVAGEGGGEGGEEEGFLKDKEKQSCVGNMLKRA